MDRRKFLSLTTAAGTAALFGKYKNLFAEVAPDLAAIKGGEPDIMFDQGIAALGGMGTFIKKGQTVVVKPNIGWDKTPDLAANTNPLLIKRIVEHCYNAGAKKVFVFDNPVHNWERTYKNSGIDQAVKDAGGVMAPGNSEKYYSKVQIPGGDKLKTAKVHELILSSDVFINVPVLKHHASSGYTVAMKNLMGIVWDRWYFHMNDLHNCIADSCLIRKPDLNIVDAYNVTASNGPQQATKDDLVMKKMQLISKDIVAIDAASVKIMGLSNPSSIRYINIANSKGLGKMNIQKLNIKKISI
jgi:uncharacterized protein (DUF362 family)